MGLRNRSPITFFISLISFLFSIYLFNIFRYCTILIEQITVIFQHRIKTGIFTQRSD